MSNVIAYDFQQNQVRVVMVDGEPWFVAKDVAGVLGYANSRKAVSDHCKHARPVGGNESLHPLDPQTTIIPERDVYRLVMRSHLPAAEEFEEWVVGDVLPSIRKHGMYATDELLDNPDFLVEVATRLRDERKARLEAEAQVQELAPKAEFYDKVADSQDYQKVREVAKVLGTGEKRLFAWLRWEQILMSNNQPYQRYIDAGYFVVKERTWQDRQGNEHLTTTTYVTGKGLMWLQKRFNPAS